MNTTDNPTTCANCGKGEESESVALKNCVACKMVKYCSRDCQKAHRSQHKKECRERAAELHDESLFKQPPLPEDCPICFLLYGRALKHFMIAVEGGSNLSLNMIQQMYMKGLATKDDYAKALRVYQAYLDEIKSDDRDKAAAYADRYKYM